MMRCECLFYNYGMFIMASLLIIMSGGIHLGSISADLRDFSIHILWNDYCIITSCNFT